MAVDKGVAEASLAPLVVWFEALTPATLADLAGRKLGVAGGAVLVDLQDVFVLEAGDGLRLALKALECQLIAPQLAL